MTRPSFARAVLSFSLLFAWVLSGSRWGSLTLETPVGLARLLPLEMLLTTPVWTLLSVVYAACVGAFLLRVKEDVVGWVLLAMLGLAVTVELSARGRFMPQLESMLAGDLLVAWLLGRVWGRRRGLSGDDLDLWAHEVVVGTLGAMMCIAACSKLWLSGIAWTDGATHCALIYEHALVDPAGMWSSWRFAMAQWYPLCAAGAWYVLVAELLGPMMIWPRWRRLYAVLMVGVFVALALMTGIFEQNWALMAVALAWSRF